MTGLMLSLVFFGACKKSRKNDLDHIDCSKINSVYSSNVKPIIDKNCLSSGCHNSGSTNGDFTTYAGVKAKVDNGSFDNRVIQQKNMPLSNELSMDDLKKIKCWLNSGAANN
ncbi:MAG: hypothetical protein Q8M29_06510 [Bacteroidota bacterium]|nr:hypothetical protein [Bacteroidota bacterium]